MEQVKEMALLSRREGGAQENIFAFCRGDEWSIIFFNCSQNFSFARFARKV